MTVKTPKADPKTTPAGVTHARPEYVKHPVQACDGYWVLGLVVPDQRGYTPNGGIFEGQDYKAAVRFCMDEAAGRGISNEACEAAVVSSMFPRTFDQALAAVLKHQREVQAALKAGR